MGFSNKILPCGSVVTLTGESNQNKKFLIIGRFILSENGLTYHDYEGITLPTNSESTESLIFNREKIENVEFEGYIDEIEEKYLEDMKEVILSMRLKREKN